MNTRILTRVLPLGIEKEEEFNEGLLTEQATKIITSFENEVSEIAKDKKELTITWLQSSFSVNQNLIGATAASFTQLTAIIRWNE